MAVASLLEQPVRTHGAPVAAPPGERRPAVVAPLIELALSAHLMPEIRRLAPGDSAWDAARDAGKVLFVREGILRVYHALGDDRRRLAKMIGPGTWVGAEVIGGGNGANLRIISDGAAVVVLVDATRFVEAALADRNAGRELIRQLARQVASVHTQLSEVTLLNCECQLVHTLLRLARNGAATCQGTRVTLNITQQDLADALGIARETVNGMLQRLADLQLVQKRRGRISFDLVQLEQWAQHIDAAARN